MKTILDNGILAVQITSELFLKAINTGEITKVKETLSNRAARHSAVLEITVV